MSANRYYADGRFYSDSQEVGYNGNTDLPVKRMNMRKMKQDGRFNKSLIDEEDEMARSSDLSCKKSMMSGISARSVEAGRKRLEVIKEWDAERMDMSVIKRKEEKKSLATKVCSDNSNSSDWIISKKEKSKSGVLKQPEESIREEDLMLLSSRELSSATLCSSSPRAHSCNKAVFSSDGAVCSKEGRKLTKSGPFGDSAERNERSSTGRSRIDSGTLFEDAIEVGLQNCVSRVTLYSDDDKTCSGFERGVSDHSISPIGELKLTR